MWIFGEEASLADFFTHSLFISLLCNKLFHQLLFFLNTLDLLTEVVEIVTESLTKLLDSLVCFGLPHAMFEILCVLTNSCFKSTGLRLDDFGKECKAASPRFRILHAGTFIRNAAHYEEVVWVILLFSTRSDDFAILAHTGKFGLQGVNVSAFHDFAKCITHDCYHHVEDNELSEDRG